MRLRVRQSNDSQSLVAQRLHTVNRRVLFMQQVRSRMVGLVFVFVCACGGHVRESRNAPEGNGVGGAVPYTGNEPTQIPTDLRPDGPSPPPNGKPMSPSSSRSQEMPLNSAVSLSGVEPSPANNGGTSTFG